MRRVKTTGVRGAAGGGGVGGALSLFEKVI